MYNCQLLIDLAGRNALWGAAAHLFEAFKPLGPPHNPSAAALPPSPAQNPNLLRAASGLQRGGSGLSPMGSRRGAAGAAPAAAKLLSQDSLAQGKAFHVYMQHSSNGICSRPIMYGLIASTNKSQGMAFSSQCVLYRYIQLLIAVSAQMHLHVWS